MIKVYSGCDKVEKHLSERGKFKLNFYLWILGGVLLFALFFWLGFHFKVWGKKFSELPKYIYIGSWVFLSMMFVFLYGFIRFCTRNAKYFEEKNSPNEKSKKIVYMGLLIVVILFSTEMLILNIPWKAEFQDNFNKSYVIDLGNFPFNRPPRNIIYYNNTIYFVRPQININKFIIHLLISSSLIVGTAIYVKYKKEKE